MPWPLTISLMFFILAAVIIGTVGIRLARLADQFADRTGLGEAFIGAVLLGASTSLPGITTSLPELVTSIAAVRQGAPTLALGGILGGNAFDTLFAAVADVGYRQGSIYQTATRNELSLQVLTILMTSVLLLGLLSRERRGIASIGFESVLLFVLYILGIAFLAAG